MTAATASLTIRLLGGFALEGPAGESIELPGAIPKALVALLAMSAGAPVPRDRALGLLWPDRAEPQARHSLRQCLSVLRAAIGPHLEATPTTIALKHATVDAVEFERLAVAADCTTRRAACERYAGPLLDGFVVRAPAFEEWLATERQRLHDSAVEAAYGAARATAEAGRLDAALELGRRLLRLQPWHEQGSLLVIRMLASLGERGAAMQQYRTLARVLQREFDTGPSVETEHEYRAILRTTSRRVEGTPSRPVLGVLPLEPGSGARDGMLAAGCSRDLVNILGRLGDLLVIDWRATEGYGHGGVDLGRVGEELDARFVLRGAVRTEADRVRLSAHLVELPQLLVRWSGAYERTLEDILSMQIVLAADVAAALQVRLGEGEQARVWRMGTSSVHAWLLFVEGLHFVRGVTRESNFLGRERMRQAIALDPDYAPAWVYLGWTYVFDLRSGWSDDPQGSLAEAERCAERALRIDPDLPDALNLRGGIDLTLGRHDAAIAVRRRSVALAPSHSESHAWLAAALYFAGDAPMAERHIGLAMRLSPFCPGWYPIILGFARLGLGRLADAQRSFAEACERLPDNVVSHAYMIITQVMAGQLEQARRHAAEVARRSPDFSVAQVSRWLLYRDRSLAEARLACLRSAGLPE